MNGRSGMLLLRGSPCRYGFGVLFFALWLALCPALWPGLVPVLSAVALAEDALPTIAIPVAIPSEQGSPAVPDAVSSVPSVPLSTSPVPPESTPRGVPDAAAAVPLSTPVPNPSVPNVSGSNAPVPTALVPTVPVPTVLVPNPSGSNALGQSSTPATPEVVSAAPDAPLLLHELVLPPPPPPPRWMFTAESIPLWQKLDTGLELGLFPGRTSIGQALEMVVLRIDPKAYAFSVLTVAPDEEARSLGDWASQHQLAAVINASMYLPDGRTSTGYLRSGELVNNARIVTRFGAFFVAEPDSADMPGAALLDRTEDPWEALLPHYNMVVQNYRLISAGRRLLWNPGGPKHSIAAVGRDGTGAILFIHCREPLTGVDFGTLLLALPIDIRLVMYVEGGSQAGLLVRTAQLTQTWMGRHPADIWTAGNESAPLPNVIGIRKRQ